MILLTSVQTNWTVTFGVETTLPALILTSNNNNNYIRPRNTRTEEMYAGRVACCPLVSHVEYAPTGQTDRRTPDRYITLFASCGQCNNPFDDPLSRTICVSWYQNNIHSLAAYLCGSYTLSPINLLHLLL